MNDSTIHESMNAHSYVRPESGPCHAITRIHANSNVVNSNVLYSRKRSKAHPGARSGAETILK
ncbi:hypothetical protein [Bifidobacterium callimiconis]|uniref:Uncharacterized protein n=1 Tax=Bifidobacterium callimiconis TaxID=2306973 RepID=A0A430FGX2_9BIFI|nr:hypothetical protein [Bifidobacterium callimiconis]RSX52041.1 hypothetical protein D2E23_0648 [Bifidobacterium callimiconis]